MAGSQDIFDSIVMADERFHAEGYREGYEEGSSLGVTEGRQHGTLHGAKIGSEGISDLDMKEDMCPRFLPARLLNPAWTQPLREWFHCVGDWSAPAHLAQLLLIHPLQDISMPAVPDLLSPPLFFFFPSPISVSCSLSLLPLCVFGTAG
ncbi:protein LTO1 homolog isoform X2 [Rhinopithecus roxellana]|uniref:protein LTO1 homolog isoform X2 n=1 Tax=Rhinopithecus roxellana TaxID=61622 RepID=UPI001237206E|nr:protein LTO1 homolog isoform X2 [Rhinopithecus roxellana]